MSKPPLRFRLSNWCDDHAPTWLADLADDLRKRLPFCKHEFIDDHCGKPEHRFCVWCSRLEKP